MNRIDKELQRIARMDANEAQLTAFCRWHILNLKAAARDYKAQERILEALLRAEHDLRPPSVLLTITSKAIARQGVHLRRTADFAIILDNLGNVLSDLHRFDEALESHEEALKIKRQALPANHPDIADSLNNLGNVLSNLHRFDEALESHEEAFTIRRQALPANHQYTAGSLNNLGNVLSDLHRFDEAMERHEEAFTIRLQSLPANHPDIAGSLNNLGIVLSDLHRFDEAMERHEEALTINRQALPANHPGIANSLNNLGIVLSHLRRFEEAMDRYEEALTINRQALPANHPGIANSLNNIGNLLQELGFLEKAMERHEEALTLRRQVLPANHPDIAVSLYNIGNLLQELGFLEKAIERHEEALTLRCQVLPANHLDIADSLYNIGNTYQALAQPEKALSLYKQSLDIFRTVLFEDHHRIAVTLHVLARAYRALGYLKPGIRRAAEALGMLLRNEQFPLSSKQVWGKKHSVREIESVAGTLVLLLDLLTQLEDQLVADEVVTALLTYKGNADIEQGLASILQATALEGSGLRILLDQRQQLQSEMARLQYSTDNQDLARVADVSQQLQRIERQLETHTEGRRLAEELQLRMITADRIQSALQPNEALLNLFVLQGGIYAQVLHTDGRHHLHKYATENLETHVAGLRKILHSEKLMLDDMIVLEPLQELYTTLISPIAEVLGLNTGLERLVISGDSFLYSLPWDLLCTPDTSTPDPLLAHLKVRLIPTPRDLVRLHHLQSLHTPTSGSAVMFGVQSFELNDQAQLDSDLEASATEIDAESRGQLPLLEADVPYITTTDPGVSFATRSAVLTEGGNANLPMYANLQGTRKEIEQLSTLLAKHGREVVAHFSPEASEHTLLNIGIAPWVLHFSTHSDVWEAQQTQTLYHQTQRADPRYDPTHPFSRAVVLLDGYTRRNFKGVLRAWELGSLDLQGTELVTFSSCNSGLGDMTAGRGVVGLSQAAFLAGAQRTITTLWPVLDRTTPDWMENVYQGRLEGFSWQDAMQKEKQRMLKYEYPLQAWGPFVLNGLA
ncbi:CHAT domain-containing protein (plasmid) [Deinococcus psychrotolerans]|uniref:CHAT domain-containing protein n=1 Tax=Deinococcus psychrotolerans TaxID=2489213 RepID=A0A3G8YKP7_9DEIO|nr:CHAT domain-containing tetratricopeptide repeat protein [Deinococcus psychrotolerans]AZI45250.1 CHAT domain-containing protein [Deinococcus psychrotolerans]